MKNINIAAANKANKNFGPMGFEAGNDVPYIRPLC